METKGKDSFNGYPEDTEYETPIIRVLSLSNLDVVSASGKLGGTSQGEGNSMSWDDWGKF